MVKDFPAEVDDEYDAGDDEYEQDRDHKNQTIGDFYTCANFGCSLTYFDQLLDCNQWLVTNGYPIK